MDEQSVVYTYNEILFGLKKEWSSDTCCNMEKSWNILGGGEIGKLLFNE